MYCLCVLIYCLMFYNSLVSNIAKTVRILPLVSGCDNAEVWLLSSCLCSQTRIKIQEPAKWLNDVATLSAHATTQTSRIQNNENVFWFRIMNRHKMISGARGCTSEPLGNHEANARTNDRLSGNSSGNPPHGAGGSEMFQFRTLGRERSRSLQCSLVSIRWVWVHTPEGTGWWLVVLWRVN